MRAAIVRKYGPPDVVSIENIPKPMPNADELLVKVVCTAVTAGDARIRGARFPKGFALPARLALGIRGPRRKVLGIVYSGIVESVGSAVTNFKVGDEVCGMNGARMGAHAEYIIVRAKKSVVKKPKNISHEDAAGVLFGGSAALYFIRDKEAVAECMRVLVNGASGAVGTNAVQLAKLAGAHVTAVTSGANSDLVKTLGADEVIDYTATTIEQITDQFDIVLDTVGNIHARNGKRLLTPNGKLLLMVATFGELLKRDKRIITGTASEKAENLEYLVNLVAEKKLQVVIDSTYSLDQIAKAYEHVDSGNKVGNCIVKI